MVSGDLLGAGAGAEISDGVPDCDDDGAGDRVDSPLCDGGRDPTGGCAVGDGASEGGLVIGEEDDAGGFVWGDGAMDDLGGWETGEVAGAGDDLGLLTAMTTTMSFCPFLQLSFSPLMKKKGPECSNLKTESPSSIFLIGFFVLQLL